MSEPPQSFVAFCEQQHPRLVSALHLYCGDLDLAQDVAQEALEKAGRRWSRVQAMQAPGGWVYRVAVNLANSHFRRRRAERRANARVFSGVEPAGHDADVADALAVRAAVLRLPASQRSAVVLRFYLQEPVARIAEILGVPVGTAKSHVHRGVAALRSELGLGRHTEEANHVG